ncbi:MAG: 2-oxo acid dehydrogenase subunit E2 [Rhizomicrobium sp.]
MRAGPIPAILRHKHADVGVAVALDFGLITPIVFRADEKGLATISNEIKSLAERAKTKKLKPNEFEGGGFAVSNLGMFGIKQFTRRHQSSACRDPGRRRGRAARHCEERPHRSCHRDDGHDVLRSSRGRRRHRRALPGSLQAVHRRTGRDAAIVAGDGAGMSDFEAIAETGGLAAVEIAASAMAERGQKVEPCPNCGKPMIGAYCAVCGQARDVNRRSIVGLVHILLEDIASFDSRIMRTGWALVAKPGELARAFREGRTQRYLPGAAALSVRLADLLRGAGRQQSRAGPACCAGDSDQDHLDQRSGLRAKSGLRQG